MGENSAIEWTHHTFNPWWGCRRVSPGCDYCYADTWAHRLGLELWDNGHYRTFSAKHWSEPLAWNKTAALSGERPRVFCASMADVFDKDAPAEERQRLWRLIEATPHLDWLLLTKRVGNVLKMIPDGWYRALPINIWLGISVVNQEEADRDIPKLLNVPAAVRFLSCEPLLGPIKLAGLWHHCPTHDFPGGFCIQDCGDWQRLSWVIVGGESGPNGRPMHPAWVYALRDQCQSFGIPFFFKQWGEWKHMGYSRGPAGPDGDKGVILDAPDPNWHPYMWKVGKKRAGRVLNDRTWDQFPNASDGGAK